jgi:hypothetical protein
LGKIKTGNKLQIRHRDFRMSVISRPHHLTKLLIAEIRPFYDARDLPGFENLAGLVFTPTDPSQSVGDTIGGAMQNMGSQVRSLTHHAFQRGRKKKPAE